MAVNLKRSSGEDSDGGKTSRRPAGGCRGGARELIDEGLSVPGSTRVTRSAKYQRGNRRHE